MKILAVVGLATSAKKKELWSGSRNDNLVSGTAIQRPSLGDGITIRFPSFHLTSKRLFRTLHLIIVFDSGIRSDASLLVVYHIVTSIGFS